MVAACHIWGHSWQRKRIRVQWDNGAVVGFNNKCYSSSIDPMPFMRPIAWPAVSQILILIEHLRASHVVADPLTTSILPIAVLETAYRLVCPPHLLLLQESALSYHIVVPSSRAAPVVSLRRGLCPPAAIDTTTTSVSSHNQGGIHLLADFNPSSPWYNLMSRQICWQ